MSDGPAAGGGAAGGAPLLPGDLPGNPCTGWRRAPRCRGGLRDRGRPPGWQRRWATGSLAVRGSGASCRRPAGLGGAGGSTAAARCRAGGGSAAAAPRASGGCAGAGAAPAALSEMPAPLRSAPPQRPCARGAEEGRRRGGRGGEGRGARQGTRRGGGAGPRRSQPQPGVRGARALASSESARPAWLRPARRRCQLIADVGREEGALKGLRARRAARKPRG